jgi:homoserine dehydrogenase
MGSYNESNSSSHVGETLKIGIFGGGVVGGGVVEILEAKKNHFKTLTGRNLEIAKVCVKDASKDRDWTLPTGCSITTEYSDILEDDSIDIVVEVMGGTTDAKEVVYSAIKKGKDVVTANKALIAACLPEIESLLHKVNSKDGKAVEFRYEAAVCGGIPIIRSMQSDFVGDEITSMAGIINGCTNFMLTAMDKKKQTYEDALAEASRLGYAEADPTLDVDGFDARSKLKILLRLAYGIDVKEEEISCRGITELAKVDFEYATMLGGTIKLVGVAKKVDERKVVAFVSPSYISSDETLASVNGATNAIEILSKNLVASTYIGQGAGRWPTANSVVNDITSIAKSDSTLAPFNVKQDFKFVNDFTSAFYIRIKYRDALGITRQCGEICEKFGVSIHSILQNPVRNRDDAAFAIITERVPLSSIKKVAADIEGLDWCFGNVFYMPVLSDNFI